jgi:hypothetical protein
MSKKVSTFESAAATVADTAIDTAASEAITAAAAALQSTAAAQPAAVAHRSAVHGSYDDIEGEVDRSDMRVPKLNIAQSIGPLSDDFPKGAWVLNRTTQLASVGDVLSFTPLLAKKTYVESLEYGTDDFPRIFQTRQECVDAGLRTEFHDELGKPEVGQALDVTLLLRAVGSVDAPEFSLEFEGERYALALWSISNWSSYNSAAKTLLTARTMYLQSLNQREWNAVTEKKTMKNGNSTFVPLLTGGPNNSEKFKDWTRSLVG